MCQATDGVKAATPRSSTKGTPLQNINYDSAKEDTPTTERTKTTATQKAEDNLRHGTLMGSLSLALLIAGFSLTMPHLQSRRDALECDSLCLGSMTSGRSALALLGGFFVSRFSDSDTSLLARTVGGGSGRRGCLYVGTVASVVGLVVGVTTFSIRGMWLSMIPGALLQQNFSVLKAMLADYHDAVAVAVNATAAAAAAQGKSSSTAVAAAAASSASARAGSVGKLGMSVGLAFMVGPLAGATLIKTYEAAASLAIVLTLFSMVLIARLPPITRSTSSTKKKPEVNGDAPDDGKNNNTRKEKEGGSILSFLNVKAARTPSAMFLMSVRVCMALAFHIFQTIWTVSLKQRFDFGPSDHGKFMSFIGLTYALSQGVVAKRVVKHPALVCRPRGRVLVIQLCCIALGVGRYVAFHTSNLAAVYAMFGFIVMALGIMNTILTSDASTLASGEERGGLYGVLESVESIAGMVGPVAGGMLAMTIDPISAPLFAVVGLYFVIFVLVTFGYERLILQQQQQQERSQGDQSISTTSVKKDS